MATNFMAASRMRILRLFINNNLNDPINWIMVGDETTNSGSSTFTELAEFTDIQLEVYLNASCCNIIKADVTGISTKRLTEELVLGIIEESLADDIEEIKPIILRVEDNLVYIAVFNRDFYQTLIDKLIGLNKPIRFLQSFVYSTRENEGGWTVFLSDRQNFVRTSKYEYYLLDDNKPLPYLLEEMIEQEKPNSILIYADNKEALNKLNSLGVNSSQVLDNLEFGIQNWNFYNQKSTKFKIKLDLATKASLFKLLHTIKYLAIFLVILWSIDMISLLTNNYRLQSELKHDLKNVVSTTSVNKNLLELAADKITNMRHERGIYDEKDAIPLFSTFLEVVSNTNTDSITQINYDHKELQIFLNNNFNTNQFNSYRNILAAKRIQADIQDYKSYAKQQKANQSDSNNNPDFAMKQPLINDNTAWLITLKPSLSNKAGSKS